ncbi:MAG: hypothetical protein JWO98_1278 [Frankiales bacterium]|nr:hypothetical protein [Frankiales bacterium]
MTATDLLAYLLIMCAATGAIVWSGLLFLAVVGATRGMARLARLVHRAARQSGGAL